MNIPLGQANVIKKLVTLNSGNKAEAIYFSRPEKQVICISTQISCNIGCKFCASPGKGKTYNITSEEMIHQIETMYSNVHNESVLLISFMGEGEPFANYKETLKTMHHVDDNYKNCKLAVSTIGLNLHKFSNEKFNNPIKLQVSVHAASDEKRRLIIPNVAPLNKLIADLEECKHKQNIDIDLNFTLIKNLNDTNKDILNVYKHFKNYHIKISKLNPTENSPFMPSNMHRYFVNELEALNISAEYHKTDGVTNNAACGQTSGLLYRQNK